MLNKVTLQGRLTADPELRRTQTGIATCLFRLAVERDFKDASGVKGADFVPVVCWRGLAETVSRYFRKGQMAVVEGRLQTRSYQGKDGKTAYVTEVVAENVYFCGNSPGKTEKDWNTEEEERAFVEGLVEEAREFRKKYGK